MAEGEGFEPPVPFRVQWFSRPPPSTTRPSLRGGTSARHSSGFAVPSRIAVSGTCPTAARCASRRPLRFLFESRVRAVALAVALMTTVDCATVKRVCDQKRDAILGTARLLTGSLDDSVTHVDQPGPELRVRSGTPQMFRGAREQVAQLDWGKVRALQQ